MQHRSLKIITLLLLTCSKLNLANQIDLQENQERCPISSETDPKTKVCNALATLKCTLYKLEAIKDCENSQAKFDEQTCTAINLIKNTICKLEAILNDTNSYCDNSCDSDDNNNDDDDEDDCPSLDFDDDCPSLDFDDECEEVSQKENKPIIININCNSAQKIKLCLNIQACKINN